MLTWETRLEAVVLDCSELASGSVARRLPRPLRLQLQLRAATDVQLQHAP